MLFDHVARLCRPDPRDDQTANALWQATARRPGPSRHGGGILHGVSSPGSASQTSYPIKAKVRGASACIPSQKHQQLTSRLPSHSSHTSLTMRHLAADTPTPHTAVTPECQRQLLLSEELINGDKQL